MKINKTTNSSNKLILIIATVSVVAISGYAAIASSANLWPFIETTRMTDDTVEPEVDSDINDTERAAQKNSDKNPSANITTEDTPSKQLMPSNVEPTSPKPVKPTVSHATQSGSSIEVVATFNTTANGTCRLTLSKPGAQNINRESPITVGPSYYICGFTVNDVSGNGWVATVTHAHNDNVSDAVTQRVE